MGKSFQEVKQYFEPKLFHLSGMIWASQHLEMNHMGTMILCLGSSFGGIIYDYIPGYFYENYGPESLLYVEIFCAAGLLILVTSMNVFVKCRPIKGPLADSTVRAFSGGNAIEQMPAKDSDTTF